MPEFKQLFRVSLKCILNCILNHEYMIESVFKYVSTFFFMLSVFSCLCVLYVSNANIDVTDINCIFLFIWNVLPKTSDRCLHGLICLEEYNIRWPKCANKFIVIGCKVVGELICGVFPNDMGCYYHICQHLPGNYHKNDIFVYIFSKVAHLSSDSFVKKKIITAQSLANRYLRWALLAKCS